MSRAAGTEPGPGPTGMFGADDEVGRDLDVVDWAAYPARAARGLAAEPADGRGHPAVIPLRDVDGLGTAS